jgi:hypothetical protein
MYTMQKLGHSRRAGVHDRQRTRHENRALWCDPFEEQLVRCIRVGGGRGIRSSSQANVLQDLANRTLP